MTAPSTSALVAEVMDRYVAGDWPAAESRLEQVLARDPHLAAVFLAPLMLAHCRIETAAPADLPAFAFEARAAGGLDRAEHATVIFARARAQELCRAGDFTRASRLLRCLADYDDGLARTLAGLLAARAPVAGWPAPSFPDDPSLTPAAIARARERFAGTRVLIVFRRAAKNDPGRVHDPFDNLQRSAQRFGLSVHAIDSHGLPDGVAMADYAPWLQREILAFKPHVVLYDDLFETGLSADDSGLAEQLALVLQSVRELLGVRVVKCLLDAWRVMAAGPDRPMRGIGACVDLLFHQHPALIAQQSAAERAQSFCFVVPHEMPRPTAQAAVIPRACFVGSVLGYNRPRLAWWAEIGRRGLPFDFIETVHGTVQHSDQEYANLLHRYQLSVSLSERPNGARILTGRPLETLLSEGVALDEDSENSAYFLARGSHYEGFGTLDELAGLIDDLLAAEPRRRRLARDGHAWVHRYFTGDVFWGGLLARLFT